MKVIGLVGGTGWISTAEYYRIINEEVNRRLGGLQFAKCVLYSFNYSEIDFFNRTGNSEGILTLIMDASVKLVTAGAECIVLCANTLHQFAERLEWLNVPVIHVGAAVASEIKKKQMIKAGLLGTKQTMEMDFYKSKLKSEGIDVNVPDAEDRDFIQHSITNELLKGKIFAESKSRFLDICEKLISEGAEGIILGCTEIPLIVKQADINVPVFNTLEIHANAAVDFSLSN